MIPGASCRFGIKVLEKMRFCEQKPVKAYNIERFPDIQDENEAQEKLPKIKAAFNSVVTAVNEYSDHNEQARDPERPAERACAAKSFGVIFCRRLNIFRSGRHQFPVLNESYNGVKRAENGGDEYQRQKQRQQHSDLTFSLRP